MEKSVQIVIERYTKAVQDVYGEHLKRMILYGSYARGDYKTDSDIDIMILLDLPDEDIKTYRHSLSDLTYDFNMEYDLDIKPIAKSKEHFEKWLEVYPFYSNVMKEGVVLYEVA